MADPVLSDGYPGGFPSDGMVEAFYAQAAREAEERIRTCHEVVACPKCGAPIGVRCWRAGSRRPGVELKHPHEQRWTLVQPAR